MLVIKLSDNLGQNIWNMRKSCLFQYILSMIVDSNHGEPTHLRKDQFRNFDSLRSHPGIDSLRASASDCRKLVCGFVRHHRMISNTDSNHATWTMLHELKCRFN